MGECNYYLKARFQSTEAAAAARPRLVALLAEGERAYDFWQDSRRRCWDGSNVSASEFWTEFHERFPLVVVYLRDLIDIPDWDNGLVGHLGNLVDPRPEREPPHATLIQDGDLLLLQLNMIWHFSDMGLLERYCREELGAMAVGSISDEQLETDMDSELEGGADEPVSDPFEAIWV